MRLRERECTYVWLCGFYGCTSEAQEWIHVFEWMYVDACGCAIVRIPLTSLGMVTCVVMTGPPMSLYDPRPPKTHYIHSNEIETVFIALRQQRYCL